jgi:hypothetical protein
MHFCIPSLLKGKVPFPFASFVGALEDEFPMHSDLGEAFLLLHCVVGLSLRELTRLRLLDGSEL